MPCAAVLAIVTSLGSEATTFGRIPAQNTCPSTCPYNPPSSVLNALEPGTDADALMLDIDTVYCACEGQAIEFRRYDVSSTNNDGTDYQTTVRIAKVQAVEIPVFDEPPCPSATEAAATCGTDDLCYFDSECTNTLGTVPLVGCNANDVGLPCRFCGGSGAYSDVPCPDGSLRDERVRPEDLEVPTKGLPPPGVVITIGGASGDGSDGDQSAEGNDGIQIASPPPPNHVLTAWEYSISNLEHTSCGMPDKVSHSINRRITWRGVNNTIVGYSANVQSIVEFMDHEGRGFYLSPTPNQCNATGYGIADPTKNCVFAHGTPRNNWNNEVHSGQTVPVGNPSNMAISLEAYDPFTADYGSELYTFHINSDANRSCANFIDGNEAYNQGRFPGFNIEVEMNKTVFKTYKETFEITDFPYYGDVTHPAHSLALIYFLDTSSPMSFSGGDGGHNAFAEGASFTLPVDIDCNAVPRPSECPFIRLADEVDIYWDLAITASGGSVLGSSSSRVPIRASVPSGTNNPVTQAFGRGCTNQFEQPVGCPANSTDNITAAFANGALYCDPSEPCGGRYIYFSFKPQGADRLVWDPTQEGRGLAKPYVEGRDPLGGFIIPFLDGLPIGTIIGIAVGSLVGLILIITLLVCCICKACSSESDPPKMKSVTEMSNNAA